MRKKLSHGLYLILVSPLIPVMLILWALEHVENSKFLLRWESAAHKLAQKVRGPL